MSPAKKSTRRARPKRKSPAQKQKPAPGARAREKSVSAEEAPLLRRPQSIITLTTDFGEGYYVGALKGAILDICPHANVVDITHEISSHDVLEAAFTLLCAYPYYPPGSIHVVVVDPGVGSDRRGIIVSAGHHYFVGPDNGVFSFVYSREKTATVVGLDARRYQRSKVSATFHGRDLFGPAAAWLARGTALERFGEEVQDYTGMAFLPAQKIGDNLLEGIVVHIDKFGNVITSLSPREIVELLGRDGRPRFFVNGRVVNKHYNFYAEAGPGEIFSLVGSSGYYEIAAHKKPAAEILDIDRGERVELELIVTESSSRSR